MGRKKANTGSVLVVEAAFCAVLAIISLFRFIRIRWKCRPKLLISVQWASLMAAILMFEGVRGSPSITGGRSWAYLWGNTTANPGSQPPAVFSAGFVKDNSGTMWIFGGQMTAPLTTAADCSVWTINRTGWSLAYSAAGSTAVYKGLAPRPGARIGSQLWPEANGFTMFGGYGVGDGGEYGRLSSDFAESRLMRCVHNMPVPS